MSSGRKIQAEGRAVHEHRYQAHTLVRGIGAEEGQILWVLKFREWGLFGG